MPKTPSYRQRKGRDQALVTLTDSVTKKRRDFWLGEFGTPASREFYHRVIAEWEANNRRLPEPGFDATAGAREVTSGRGPTIDDVCQRFWRWAKDYYQPCQAGTYKIALHLVCEFYGQSQAVEFGPSKLRMLREEMIRGNTEANPQRIPWSRRYINQQMQRIRQMFKWAASHEMLPSSVYETLATIEPLKRGRTDARENKAVGPVDQHLLDGVRPHLNRQVRALAELQLLTGARPGELLGMRAIDIEMHDDDTVWMYRPKQHKNAYREIDRTIYLGPRAQRIIEPFLADRPVDAFLFSPAEAEKERRVAVHAARKTPISGGNRPGVNRRSNPKRSASDRYTSAAYYRAIQYACDKAFPPPAPLAKQEDETNVQWQARLKPKQKDELKVWRREHRWHPHQLRHNAGTQIRREFGLGGRPTRPRPCKCPDHGRGVRRAGFWQDHRGDAEGGVICRGRHSFSVPIRYGDQETLPMPVAVLDSDNTSADLGLVCRRNRPGPEQRLVDWFLKERLFRVPRGCRTTVFCEPQLESGYPDIVIVIWRVATAQQWELCRLDLDRPAIRLLHYLHHRGPTDIEDLRGTFGQRVASAVDQLHAAKTVRRTRAGWTARALSSCFAVQRIIAIEAKVGKWAIALNQALTNTWFASDSHILVPHVPRGSDLLDRASRLGIRVLTREDPDPVAKLCPRADLPRSYASWLFNEWVWRQHFIVGEHL